MKRMLVAAAVFGLAGLFIVALFGVERIAERFAISRMNSRNHDGDSFRVA